MFSMAKNRQPYNPLFVRYDKKLMGELAKPPKIEGVYRDIFGDPIPHVVFLGDMVPGENLFRIIASELKESSNEKIDSSSLTHIIGTSCYDGRQFNVMKEMLMPYKHNSYSFNMVGLSYGSPLSLSYFDYSGLMPIERIGLIFTLPSGEKTNPSMVFMLEDRLRDMVDSTDYIEEFATKPTHFTDKEFFRKSFIKDYLAKNDVPYLDLV